tara:strand:+ start:360 stop:701 length:342 start_codon:yes stop_codon:yes gene_type:complete
MTSPTRTEREQWGTILELSTRMLEQAEIRDWDSLTGLMDARDKLLKLYFTQSDSVARNEELREQIAMIQDNDRLIVELTKTNRELLADELIKLQKAKQTVNAYQLQMQRLEIQ